MRCNEPENLLEHGNIVAMLALMAGTIANNNGKQLNILNMVSYGLLHDVSETLSQDLISPIKNATPAMQHAYQEIEHMAEQAIINTLPDELQALESYFHLDGYEGELCKACDRYATYIKCVQETAAGNHIEFGNALVKTKKMVDELIIKYPEMKSIHDYFSEALDKPVDCLVGGSLFD